MSFVIALPEMVTSAASDLAGIGSRIAQANAAAAPDHRVLPAARDEVSAAVASLFSGQAQEFQALSTQAATFHQQFVQRMNGAAAQYADAEAAGVAAMTVPNIGYGNTGTSNVGFSIPAATTSASAIPATSTPACSTPGAGTSASLISVPTI